MLNSWPIPDNFPTGTGRKYSADRPHHKSGTIIRNVKNAGRKNRDAGIVGKTCQYVKSDTCRVGQGMHVARSV